jgi:hypothetical protein
MAYINYYPYSEQEENYLRFLEAPGVGLGLSVGDAPQLQESLDAMSTSVKALLDDALSRSVSSLADKQIAKQSLKEERQAIKAYAKRARKTGSKKLATTLRHARKEEKEHASMFVPFTKALPKSSDEKPVKRAPTSKASSKALGKTGTVRSGYPQEQQQQPQPQANPPRVPGDQKTEPEAKPEELATMLGLPLWSLQRIAKRFKDVKNLNGRAGFVTFMKTKLKAMANKHQLDGDYFGLIYDALCSHD